MLVIRPSVSPSADSTKMLDGRLCQGWVEAAAARHVTNHSTDSTKIMDGRLCSGVAGVAAAAAPAAAACSVARCMHPYPQTHTCTIDTRQMPPPPPFPCQKLSSTPYAPPPACASSTGGACPCLAFAACTPQPTTAHLRPY
jgi:hypothetical protein